MVKIYQSINIWLANSLFIHSIIVKKKITCHFNFLNHSCLILSFWYFSPLSFHWFIFENLIVFFCLFKFGQHKFHVFLFVTMPDQNSNFFHSDCAVEVWTICLSTLLITGHLVWLPSQSLGWAEFNSFDGLWLLVLNIKVLKLNHHRWRIDFFLKKVFWEKNQFSNNHDLASAPWYWIALDWEAQILCFCKF